MATKRSKVKRGDIFLVNFDPALGSEIQKVRPALVLQNDIDNEYSPVTIVAAVSSYTHDEKVYPTEVFVHAREGGLDRDSVVLLNQLRTIDKQRLRKRLGSIRSETIDEVERALQISLGITEL